MKNLLILIIIPFLSFAQEPFLDSLLKERVINEEHASNFAKLLVLDNEKRIRSYHAVTLEVLKKVSGTDTLYRQNSSQILLGMSVDPLLWQMVPLIKVSDPDILQIIQKDDLLIPLNNEHGPLPPVLFSFLSFFDNKGQYILIPYVESANNKTPINRTKFDQNILYVNESVNICSMVFSHNFFKLFPSSVSDEWTSDVDMHIPGVEVEISFNEMYRNIIMYAIHDKSYEAADGLLMFINEKQNKYLKE